MAEVRVSSRSQGVFLASAALVYATLLAIAEHAHVFWRDEAEVWIAARGSASLPALLQNIRYEGHPPAWYVVMYLFTRWTWNPEWMKVVNGAFSFGVAVLILYASRLPVWVRIGLIFAYGIVFEYAVIDRNYMMGILCLVAAVVWDRRGGRLWGTTVLLCIAALTSIPAMIVAVCLFAALGWPRRRALGASGWLAVGAFALSVVLSVASCRPPADSGLMAGVPPGGAGMEPLQHMFIDVSNSYLPVPVLSAKFWQVTLIGSLSVAWGVCGGVAIMMVACLLFLRQRRVEAFFLAATFLLLVQLRISRRAYPRHVGWLFIVFLLALLLAEVDWTGWRRAALAGLLAVQSAGGLLALSLSLHYRFSGSLATADFLRERGLANATIVAAPSFCAIPVLAYLQRPKMYLEDRHRLGSIVLWDKTELASRGLRPDRAEMDSLSGSGEGAVLLTDRPLNQQEAADLGVHELAAFNGPASRDWFFIYR